MATSKTPKKQPSNSAWTVEATKIVPPPPLTAEERATNERIHAEKRKYERGSQS